jgi:hypothetical protein
MILEIFTATFIYGSGHKTEDVGTYSSESQCKMMTEADWKSGKLGNRPKDLKIDCHIAGKNYYEGVERMMKTHGMAAPVPPPEHHH